VSGARFHALTSPGRYRALTALFLLAPGTPLLFQGQEFAASAPFVFFADHKGDLGKAVRTGRAGFMAQFPSAATPEAQAALSDPGDEGTFRRCVLDWSERRRNAGTLALHRDLLALKRDDPTLRDVKSGSFDGAVLGPEAFVLRFFGAGDRALVVNLGRELRLPSAPEPLLAPPEGGRWQTRFSSNDVRYGGPGAAPFFDGDEADEGGLVLPGEAAVLLGSA
jgi:maltooligosyltrehalose trehalohydrolase